MTLVATDPAAPAAPHDDADVVRRIGQGDRTALAELYERHAGWLTTRLTRRCGNPELVDTALQDTFLAVWKQAASYRPTGEVGAWLWTIAVRRLIDQLRKRPPPQPVDDVVPLADVIVHEVPLALGHTELGAAFASLDPDLQAVMAATALDGLTTKETAHLLGIPAGTVKSRLSRARQVLQEQLR
ncbi:MAG: RNA polymerase sigma factor [Actinomycetota bacterium]